jgi:hypothetical protein
MFLDPNIKWTEEDTWMVSFGKFIVALEACNWVSEEMNSKAVIEWVGKPTWRLGSSDQRYILGGYDRMHLVIFL